MRSRATTTTTRPGTSKGTHFIRPSTSAGAGSNATASHERGGTPKHTPGSTATSSTRHRNPPEKESKPQSISRRQSSVLGLRDRQPARDGTAQRHAKEVEGLKDYQLGHCLGRGAFGSVLCFELVYGRDSGYQASPTLGYAKD
jgi:hypothetical protein